MIRRSPWSSLAALSIALCASSDADSQQVDRSTVSGRLVSASVAVPVGQTSVLLFQVPEDRWLVLTQVCLEATLQRTGDFFSSGTLPRIAGNRFGAVPASGCTAFHPGLALEPGESLRCETREPATPGSTCLITGVLTEDGRRDRGKR